jgi:hypothetical protein
VTISRIPVPDGGGGGTTGLDDVTGTYPVEVDALGTDRNVRITLTPETSGVALGISPFPRLGRYRVEWCCAVNGTTSIANFGQTLSSGAFDTSVSIANTSYFHSCVRTRITSTAVLNNTLSLPWGASPGLRGVGVQGGVMSERCFGYNALNADSKMFHGFSDSVGVGSVFAGAQEPSTTMLSCVGFALDSTDTNWQLIHNDATGTCTKHDTGIARPVAQQDVVYIAAWTEPGSGTIHNYMQYRNDPTQFYYLEIGADLPLPTMFWNMRDLISVGPTSAVAVQFDWMRLQISTQL